MASYNATKKMLIFNILDILHKKTDADHTLTLAEIKTILLNEYGMEAERKAIRRNIDDLIDYGFDINYTEISRSTVDANGEEITNNKCTDFYMINTFDDTELRYLIDSLLFSKHIPAKNRSELINKLEGLSNNYFRSRVKYIATVPEESVSSKELFYTIEIIDEAISSDRQVTFNYCEYLTDKKLHLRKDKNGKTREYIINPYQMAASGGKYYLICNQDGFEGLANYRLDRIKNIKLLETKRLPEKKVKGLENGFNLPKHMAEHIYMFQDGSAPVTFRMKKYLVGEVIDWFGKDIQFFDENEEEVSARVTVNIEAMRKWALQYALHAQVLAPESLRKQLKEDIEKAKENYK